MESILIPVKDHKIFPGWNLAFSGPRWWGYCFGFRGKGLEFRVQGLGFRVRSLRFKRVSGLGLLGREVQDLRI